MPESTRDDGLKAAVSALVKLGDAAAASSQPDPELDEARDAFTRAALYFADDPTEN
jgi:hypothetical protein